MQKKQKELKLIRILERTKATQYFILYTIGLLSYGIGSSLFLNKVFLEKIVIKSDRVPLKFVGVLCVLIGIGILLFIVYQYYQKISLKQKMIKAIQTYILLVFVIGLVVGGIGKLIFEFTDRDYDWVKQLIWILTTLMQGELRFILIYYCLTLYKEKEFDWKSKGFLKLLLGVCLLLGVSILCRLLYPLLGTVVMFITDMMIMTGIVYFELVNQKKEN
ncbi:hypothetical protein GYN67_05515 [Lactococcus piscium]|uniref:hypothetical protein n=1 Tax=Pseudolactococcus carnosus TaxID=2749961 RepID=UPI001FB87DD2|nr:hypothetical protein [Lactococcus carnosus]MCJ1996140.1 hypothetical protein [Lactococcus carnosus]